MNRVDQYSVPGREITETNRGNQDEIMDDTNPLSKCGSVSLNDRDVIFKMTQNDYMREINSYRNETLAKAEKELTYGTEDTGIDPSPPMSLEEMNCGRISPIQAKDVYPLIDGKNMLRPKLTNIEVKKNDFGEILNPSVGLMSYSANQFLQGPSCSHDHYATSTILGKHYTEECQSHEYSAMKDGDPSNSTIIFRKRMSSKLDKKFTIQDNHNDISQKKSIKFSSYLSNHEMLNISYPEIQFNAHFMCNDAEIEISNQSGENRSGRVISDDTEMPTLGEGVTYDRSAIASGVESFSGLSWRLESENNTAKEYFKSSYYQGELLPKAAARRSLWDNVRKVYLPDSSSYAKSHGNTEPKFLSVLFNSNQNSGSELLPKNDSNEFNLTSNLRNSESLCMMKKPIGNSTAEVEKYDQVSAIPFVKGLDSPKKLLQLPLKREEIGSKSRENESKTDEVREFDSWDNHNGKIQAIICRKGIQNKEFDEMKTEVKPNLEGQFITEERVQLRLCRKLENVIVEESPSHILPGMKPFGIENKDGTENHDLNTSSKNKMGIAEDVYSDCGKEESAAKEVVGGELNALKQIGKDTKDSDDMSISMEEISFRKDIDKLVDDILAEREAEFLSEENLLVKIGVNVDKTFGGVGDELMKIPTEVRTSKVVVEDNVQCALNIEETKYVNSQKSGQVSHFEMTETDCEKIIRVKEEKAEFQVRNEERTCNAETESICVKGVEMAETVEVGEIVDLENVQMKNILAGTLTEKVQEFAGELNELRDVELNFTDDKIKGRKLQTLDASTELKYNVKDDVGQPSNHDDGVENTSVSVAFKFGKSLDSKNTAMGDGDDSIDIKEKEVDTSVYTYETEFRVRTFERADALCPLAVKDDIICNDEQSIQDNSIAIPLANIETDFKETNSPKDEITKKWKDNNDGGNSEVEGGNTEEYSFNSKSMGNNDKVNEKDLSDLIEGKNVSTSDKSDCEEEDIFLQVSDNKCIEDECVTSKRENTGHCTLENHSFFHQVEILSARSKDLVNDREDNVGINHEQVEISAHETINNGKANILEVTSFQNAENGSFMPMEDKNDDNKAHSMEEKDALNDFLENENSLVNEKFECNTMKHLVEEPVTSLLLNELEISNSTDMSEVGSKVCKLVHFIPMHQEPSASYVEIDMLEENESVDGNESLNLSNIDNLCKMDVVLRNCDLENHRVFEMQDALGPEKNSTNDQLDLFTGKWSPNGSMELNKITVVKDSEDIDKSKDECYSSQRGKDYMISGVEVTKNYPRNDYEYLGSENKILNPLEIDSCEGSIVIVDKDIRESMKPSSEILPIEFDGIEKLSDLQPNNLILDESKGEDKDLNIVIDPESFVENKQLSNTLKNQSQIRPESTPKDATFFYAHPSSSFTNVGDEENSKDGKNLDLSSFLNNCHEIMCATSCIKNGIHQNFNADDSVTNPPNFTNQNKSTDGGINESGINYDSVDKVFGVKPNNEFAKADFYHENLVDVKSSGSLVHGIYTLNQEEIFNEIGEVSPKHASYYHEGALMNEEKNDHQIVPDGTETQNTMASEKGKLLSEEQGKTKSESKGNSIVTESSPFSLDSYLDSLVDKQLLYENKGDLMSSTTCHSCSQSVDAGCQTQLCGLLNTVHSCRCLETHLLSDGEFENLQLKGRKRTLQALNLEGLHLRNKRFKLQIEAISLDSSPDIVFVKDEPPPKIDCVLNNQSNWINSNMNTVTENVANDFGSEFTTKGPTHPVKLHENDWEELEEVQFKRVEIKEVSDQKVPDVEFHQDCLAGLEEKSLNMSDNKEDTNPRRLPSFSNLYHRSTVLRLGLSKRAKLPRLHHQK